MFIGRLDELKKLNKYYINSKNSACVMYSIPGMGKTELVSKFISDKESVYHVFSDMTADDIKRSVFNAYGKESLYEVILEKLSSSNKKYVIVLDEFQYLVSADKKEFLSILDLIENLNYDGRLMLICTSSSVKWTENEMGSALGIKALKFGEIFKLNEFSMLEIMSMFSEFTLEDAIKVYSVYGGIPAVLSFYDSNKSFKDNIKELFDRNKIMNYYPEYLLKKELRELSQYNALLLSMADNCWKINDIYERTGFSRPKISVYIKNLIDIDVVEKVFSYNGMNSKNSMKGLYRIKIPFLNFYYRYVMFNHNVIDDKQIDELVEDIIDNKLVDEYRRTYESICMDYLKLSCKYNKIDFNYTSCWGWYGKNGDIPIILANDSQDILVGFCKWEDTPVDADDIKAYKKIIKSSKAAPKKIYIFSKEGFTKQINRKYKEDEVFVLINNSEL